MLNESTIVKLYISDMKKLMILPIIIAVLIAIKTYYGMAALGIGNQSDMGTLATLVIVAIGAYLILNNLKLIKLSRMSYQWIPWSLWMLFTSLFYNPMPHGPAAFLGPIFCPIVFMLCYIMTIKYEQMEIAYTYFFSIFMVVLLILCVMYTNILAADYNGTFYASNMVFFPLCCMPFLFLIRNKKEKYLLLALLFIVVLYTQKRSAAIVMLVVTLMEIRNSSSNRNYVPAIFILLLIYISMNSGFFGTYLDNMAYRLRTMNEDGGSGRTEILPIIWASLLNNDPVQWLIGRGDGSIVQTGFPNAHNDPLQLLYEYGLIGLIFYVIFVVRSIKSMLNLCKKKSMYYPGYFSCIAIILIMGSVSNLFVFGSFFAFLCAYMGIVSAKSALKSE